MQKIYSFEFVKLQILKHSLNIDNAFRYFQEL